MRNVGIVRRLDALGRIVIPREYRKMHRIELGDPLEIIAMDNGEIVLRKVDLTAELTSFGQVIAEAAAKETERTVLVGSPRVWVTGSGTGKSQFVGYELPVSVTKALAARKELSGSCLELGLKDTDTGYAVICPITGDLDCFGVLAVISPEPITEAEAKLARTLASVTGNNLQKY